jgi:hypothetical protein
VKNAEKIVAALAALHKALGESWSTEIRNYYGKDAAEITFQAENEKAHRKLAGYFGFTPEWKPNTGGKTESLESAGEVGGVRVRIFAPSRSVKAPGPTDIRKTAAVVDALKQADEAVRP